VVTGTDTHIATIFNFPSCDEARILTRMQASVRCAAFDKKGQVRGGGR
jgi:chromosome transmission fidelity protein 4